MGLEVAKIQYLTYLKDNILNAGAELELQTSEESEEYLLAKIKMILTGNQRRGKKS